MRKTFDNANLQKFSDNCKSAQSIVIVSHTNPDGDAIGSGLALLLFLREQFEDKTIRFFVPNQFPEFLQWVDPHKNIEIFSDIQDEATAYLAQAELVIVVDFNHTSRLEKMTPALEANTHAPRILIDHHINPPQYDLSFHTTESSSTALLIYSLIEYWVGTDDITTAIARALYLGMMTDTGCFSYGNLNSVLYRAVAVLTDKGIDPLEINRAVHNQQSESKLRMVGYLISEKLTVNMPRKSAYITITREEKERFNHQIGDTEGVVNIPLTIKGIEFSAIMIEALDHIKISLRSAGALDVNILCNQHFNGGGHRNAAGGKFFGSMSQAVAKMEEIIASL